MSFSETTYPIIVNDSLVVITPDQLKTSNLIFIEHNKFKNENIELKNQVGYYNDLISSYKQINDIKNEQIDSLSIVVKKYDNIIVNQQHKINSIDIKRKIYTGLTIAGVSISVTLLIILLAR